MSAFTAGDYPGLKLDNGVIQLSIYLPDAEKGYYRETPFDWSGIIERVDFNGHRFYGALHKEHDPLVHDAISGPVEEFATLGDAHAWVLKFVHWYNTEHKHSGSKFMTQQQHCGATAHVMDNRKIVYEAARASNPRRWSQGIRDWDLPESVWLNPESHSGDLEVAA